MELLGLNVGNYLVAKLFGDDEVKINCAVADAVAQWIGHTALVCH